MTANIRKAAMSTATIVDPTGVPPTMDMIIPMSVHTTDRIAEHTVTE